MTMKKIAYMACMALLLTGATSCGPEPLSKRSAKKAIERDAMFAKDSQVAQFKTGYYEVTPEELDQLAQLKAAGVVQYSAEGVMEVTQDRKWVPHYEYYYGMRFQNGGHYSYTDREIPHAFVTVTLTEDGKKYVVENPTTMRKEYAGLAKHNEDFKEVLPDYMNATDKTFEKLTGKPSEKKKENTTATEKFAVADTDTAVAVEEVVAEESDENSKAKAPDQKDKNAKYKACLERVKTEDVNVLLGRFKIVKVLDVCCTEDMYKAGKGSCNVVYTFTDATPFGYVLGSNKPDYYLMHPCSFRLYEDTGWVLEETPTVDE